MEEMRRRISNFENKVLFNSEIQLVVWSSLFTSLLEYMFRCMCLREVGGRETPSGTKVPSVFEPAPPHLYKGTFRMMEKLHPVRGENLG